MNAIDHNLVRKISKQIKKIDNLGSHEAPEDYSYPQKKYVKLKDLKYEKDIKVATFLKRTEVHCLVKILLENGWTIDQINSSVHYHAYGSDYTQSLQKFNIKPTKIKREDYMNQEDFQIKIANYPYQDSNNKAKNAKLWHKFVLQDINNSKDGTMLLEVTPSSVVNGAVGTGKKLRKRFTDDWDLIEVDFRTNNEFNVGVDICSWVAVKRPYSGSTKVITDAGEAFIDYRIETSLLPKTQEHRMEESIIKSMWNANNHYKLSIGNEIPKDELSKEPVKGHNIIYHSGTGDRSKRWTKRPAKNKGILKLVMPFSCSPYGDSGMAVMKEEVGMLNYWMKINNKEEGEKLISLFNTKPYKILILDKFGVYKTSGFAPAIKNSKLPVVDYHIGMSDGQVCDLLGLTEEQKRYVQQWQK